MRRRAWTVAHTGPGRSWPISAPSRSRMSKKRTSGCQTGACRWRDPDAVQRFHHAEHAEQYSVCREVLLHLLLGERIAGYAQFFRSPRHVPCLQLRQPELVRGELGQLFKVALRKRFDPGRKIVEEDSEPAAGDSAIFGIKRQFRIAREAEHARSFPSQLQDLLRSTACCPTPDW